MLSVPSTKGPISLYYEETGSGFPLVWCHEFGGDYRSWEPQVRYFARRHRVVTWNYRGYPPSSVPDDPEAYSVEACVADLRALLAHLGITRAHIGGLSMGGGVALNFGIAHPELVESLIIASAGSGTLDHEQYLRDSERQAQLYEARGGAGKAEYFATAPGRRGFALKDPRGWAEFLGYLTDHSGRGSALTLRGVQMKRKTIFELEADLRRVAAPTLIIVGDQDDPCIEPGLFMKRHMPHAGLLMLPMTGHTGNIEEPMWFNQHVAEFLAAVSAGRWGTWYQSGE